MIKINTLYSLEDVSNCYYINNKLEIININTSYIKKQTIGKRGYYYVTLNTKENKQKKVYVHKIVALSFINNGVYDVVNHIDGNKLNNEINNLEFTSYQENTIHAFKTKLIKRKETIYQVVLLFKTTVKGTIKELVEKLGVSSGKLYELSYNRGNGEKYGVAQVSKTQDYIRI